MKNAVIGDSKDGKWQLVGVWSDDKADAQSRIGAVRAWARMNGLPSKLAEFTVTPSQWSNLDLRYYARIWVRKP